MGHDEIEMIRQRDFVTVQQVADWLSMGSNGDDSLRERLEHWAGLFGRVKGWHKRTLLSHDDIAEFPQWVKNAMMRGIAAGETGE